ncbi:hypothetical protein ACN42_g3492 [Penicillium freii]|uniref:Uncharacterized protein n=1 Tax=Penicillium freii TaxID=48697 RepID=A0A101MN34_PENFR|nr:hypothetical protein ACN42_g3492 [Penicillium freii]
MTTVCEKFDWWEEVEQDLAMKTKAVGPNPITAPKLDNEHASLLGRQQFDWWEDVENDIVMKTQGIPPASPVPITTPKLDNTYSANDITVETEDLAVISTRPTTATILNDKTAQLLRSEHDNRPDDATYDIAMETEDPDVQKELLPTTNSPISENGTWSEDAGSNIPMGAEDLTSNSGPVTAAELDDTYSQPSHSETSNLANDVENTLTMNHALEINVVTTSSNEVIDEYEYRALIGREDPAIHHWNWFGWPVYGPTTTPPAVSLAFMQAEPKVPHGSDQLRVASIMNRAIHQIDPVILRVTRGNEALLQMHGSALVEACNDHTYNHYSLHGNWMNDDFAMRQMIVPDLAGIPAVGSTSHGRFAIGNGIFENGPLISRNEWVEWQDQLVAATKEPSPSPRKMTWKPSLSNLKIESMESQALPLNQLPTYFFLPLEVLSNMIQPAGVAPKKTVHTPVSSPIGIMETVTRKAWSGRKSTPAPDTPLTIRPGIMGDLIKKAWATPCDSLRKPFDFSP